MEGTVGGYDLDIQPRLPKLLEKIVLTGTAAETMGTIAVRYAAMCPGTATCHADRTSAYPYTQPDPPSTHNPTNAGQKYGNHSRQISP